MVRSKHILVDILGNEDSKDFKKQTFMITIKSPKEDLETEHSIFNSIAGASDRDQNKEILVEEKEV